MIYGEFPKLSPIAFKFSLDRYSDWKDWKETCIPRLKYASTLSIKHLNLIEPHSGTCVVIGAGPTVNGFLEELRGLKNKPGYFLGAVNRTHDFLIKNGIIPDFHVLFENDVEDVEVSLGGPPHKDVAYYISSHCHPNITKQLSNNHCTLFQPDVEVEDYRKIIGEIYPDEPLVGGDAGYITFFRSFAVGHILGYRKYELYGIDSSFEGSDHIDGYKGADLEPRLKVWGRKRVTGEYREFITNGTLAFQAYRFIFMCDGNPGLKIKVHGDNLMRYIHQGRYPEMYRND